MLCLERLIAFSSAVLTLWCCGLSAQSHLAVPGRLDAADGNSRTSGLGLTESLRHQVVVDAASSSALAGQAITEVWLRRDRSTLEVLGAGEVDMSVRASWTTVSARSLSRNFEQNHGQAIEVFRGRVTLPRSPLPTGSGGPSFWSPDSTLRLRLATTLQGWQPGLSLCLDFVGNPVTGRQSNFWPLDCESTAGLAQTAAFGNACGRYADPRRPSVNANAGTWTIGSTAVIRGWGSHLAPAFLLLGPRMLPPLDLGWIGAPGCFVYVQPSIVLSTRFSPLLDPRIPGGVEIKLPLPSNQTLLGANLFAQWIGYGGGLETSEGLQIAVATIPSAPEMSSVTAPLAVPLQVPVEGDVRIGHAPVMRLLLRPQ